MTVSLISGMLLGLSSGLSPGPLLALVLAQTLRHGPREGCKIALSPLITDAPIIILALAFASKLSELRPLLGVVAIAGGAFVLYLAWDSLRPARADAEGPVAEPRSWFKGILTNLISPHPWLFWMTVGAAILAKAIAQSWWIAAAFLFGFYLLLVGSKVAVALLVAHSREFLTGRAFQIVLRVLAGLLAVFAMLLFREGLKHLTATQDCTVSPPVLTCSVVADGPSTAAARNLNE